MKNDLQQTEQWFKDRAGMFTASKFKVLQGKGRSKDALFSDTGMSYIRQKVAERFGSYEIQSTNQACKWGNEYEPKAIQSYEFEKGTLIEPVGFISHPSISFMGASADGILLCLKGGIEVKCPFNPANHIRYATDINYIIKEHGDQMTGVMSCLELEFIDFISYDPRSAHDTYIKRFERDDKKVSELEARVKLADEVAQEMIELIEQQQKKGMK